MAAALHRNIKSGGSEGGQHHVISVVIIVIIICILDFQKFGFLGF